MASASERTDEDDGPDGRTYTVRQGDTLADIAERVYGDRQKFPLIAQANGVGAQDLQVGQSLKIPPAP